MAEVPQARDDRSLGELLSDLTREITTLVRQEANLAKTELSQKAARIGMHVASLAAGGALVHAGLLAILAAIIALLVEAGLAWWASALLVGLVVAGAGGFLAWKGINSLKQESLAPRQTIESLKEDVQWARKQTT